MTHSIPFELKVPTDRMQKALDELAAKKGKKFGSMDELKKDLLSWDIRYLVPPRLKKVLKS